MTRVDAKALALQAMLPVEGKNVLEAMTDTLLKLEADTKLRCAEVAKENLSLFIHDRILELT